MSSKSVDYSIIIPAYKESGNLKELITRIFDAFKSSKQSIEVIVVDDNSNDGSKEIVDELGKSLNARIIVRTTERGLSSAVLRGFDEAKGRFLLCMDADLQHPPEMVPKFFEALEKDDKTEYVLGTRYGSGSMKVDSNWPLYRRVISKGARLMARPLTPLSDPMSGFFAITKSAYSRARQNVNPIGFKIAMELFVKANIRKHSEIPFNFGVRLHGYSKLSSKVIVHYLKHLWELYQYRFSLPVLIIFIIAVMIFTLFCLQWTAKKLLN